MTIHPSLYSSRTEEWPTPTSFFQTLDLEFRFTLDPCAAPDNAKCPAYFTKERDGLQQDWRHHRVFCNPPYGKADEIHFVRGRLKFGDGRQSAPFPSMVAIYLPRIAY